eukprot:1986874-Rhodomonas_salina.4
MWSAVASDEDANANSKRTSWAASKSVDTTSLSPATSPIVFRSACCSPLIVNVTVSDASVFPTPSSGNDAGKGFAPGWYLGTPT